MSSIISEIENSELLGEHSWRLPENVVVRELVGVTVAEARQRLKELQKLDLQGKVVVPKQLVYEQKRLFYRRPWLEGSALPVPCSLEDTERLLAFMASLPAGLVLYDLRPEHIIATPQGLRLVDPGFASAGKAPYASPEQCGRGAITPAIGKYQLGATLLELMTGTPPQDAMTLLIPKVEPPLIDALPSSLAKRFKQLLEASAKNRPDYAELLQELQAWKAFRVAAGAKEEAEAKAEHDRTVWDEQQKDRELVGDTLTELVRKQASTASGRCQEMMNNWWQRRHVAMTMFGVPLLISAALGAALWGNSDKLAAALGIELAGSQPKAVETPSLFDVSKPLPQSWVCPVDGARMILIPAGPFYEGPDPEAGVGAEPTITTLPAFYIDRYEVTNRQFKKFVEATGYKAEGCWQKYATASRLDHPVIGVSWYDAQAYAQWAGKRLPTGEEWEKAARGGDARRFPWGNQWEPERLNSFESNRGNTAPVGSYPRGASPYGVEDMAGNVWEWVDSWYMPMDSDGSLPMLRQIRGGSRGDEAAACLIVTKRGVFPENGRLVNSGFRCVVDPQHPGVMGDGNFVELKALPAGTGYERSHMPQPKDVPAPAPTPTPDYNDAYDTYGGDYYGDPYAGSYTDPGEGYYDPGFGGAVQRDTALPAPEFSRDNGYSGDDSDSLAPQSTMKMSSQYTSEDDKELTGDF